MKKTEREQARGLRRQGLSLGEIRRQLGVAKSSVSLWVRDIELTPEQLEHLRTRKGNRGAGRERFSRTMRLKREEKIAAYYREADAEYEMLSQDIDFMFGLALYIGEGDKTAPGMICISNCDPRVLHKSVEFLLKIGAPLLRVRCGVILHPGLSGQAALDYWCMSLRLDPSHFCRVRYVVTKASQGKFDHRQPYGTCRIYVCSTKLRYKVARWMELALSTDQLTLC